MRLKDILINCEILETVGSQDIDINEIQFDSRLVKEGDLFVATRGTNVDGHDFIEKAIISGASSILCEDIPEKTVDNVTYLKVANSSKALGEIAAAFYDFPSREMKIVGVTGTNGKTTTATLLYNIIRKLGYKAGLLSTIRNYIDDKEVEATHTTPDALQMNKLFREMVDAGCEYCFMEVSSHALHQERVAGVEFAGGLFTNITHDHLDYHGSFSNYIKAKKKFFDELGKDKFALINNDNKNGAVMVQNCSASKSTYGLRTLADYKAKIIEQHFDGSMINIDGMDVWTFFIGKFNIYNILSVYACALQLGFDKNEVLTALSELKPVEGRFEAIRSEENVTAIVDYAHTPDAVLNVIESINEIRNDNQKLITVIGAGGDRDKTKRPEMAKIAANNSDQVILTSDNPRSEDPMDIINDMRKGVDITKKRNVLAIADRREAIKTACLLAQPGDIILVAGKGHETYQEVNGVKSHFDDREVIREIFKELNS